MDLSVVIPVFNSEKTLPELYKKIRRELSAKFTFEVIFVFDCGKDNSWAVIEELINSDPSTVRGYHLKRNYGQHNAILFGMTKAKGDYVITLDDDLQHDPRFIHDLISEQKAGDYDVVYGKFEKLRHSGLRIRTSEMLRRLLRIIVHGIYPDYSPYRLIKNATAKKIAGLKNSYSFIDGYIGWATNKISYVPVEHYKRADGVSSYSYYRLVKHALLIAIAYSRIKTWILLLALVFNLIAIGFIVFDHDISGTVTSRIATGFLSIGICLLVLGLSAEIIHFGNLRRNTRPIVLK